MGGERALVFRREERRRDFHDKLVLTIPYLRNRHATKKTKVTRVSYIWLFGYLVIWSTRTPLELVRRSQPPSLAFPSFTYEHAHAHAYSLTHSHTHTLTHSLTHSLGRPPCSQGDALYTHQNGKKGKSS